MPDDTLYLVDGSSYLYRAFHVPALQRLSNAEGQPTGALYGVINMVKSLLDSENPRHMAVVFDAPGKNFRHEMYADYKANRPPMPEELKSQIEPLKAFIRALGIPLIEVEGVEADDVIGTLARKATDKGMQVVISTGDKDMAQLVNDRVSLVNTMTNTAMDAEGVAEKFGVKPEQIVDFLALTGDKSDNIPGVPKVGAKTAAKWLQQYGSLDALLAHAGEIKGKVGESLREHAGQLPLSRELVTIRTDLDLDIDPQQLVIGERDTGTLDALIEEYGMFSLREEKKPSRPDGHYVTIQDEKTLDEWLAKAQQRGVLSLDLETTSLDPMRAQIVGFSIASKAGEAAYIPVAHQTEEPQLPLSVVMPKILKVANDPNIKLIGQHFKYDMNVLASNGATVRAPDYDTMLESYVLNPSASRHDMDSLARHYLNRETTKYEDICGKGAKQICFSQLPLDTATAYAAEDADVTLQLHQVLWDKLKTTDGQKRVFETIEMPLVPVLAKMEQTGVLIDKDELQRQSADLAEKMRALEKKAWELAGHKFNLNSTNQIKQVLFEEMGLPVLRKTPKGQPSTAEDVLEELAREYDLPRLILQYRSLAKLKSTYLDKLPKQINPKTGRVHTQYHQANTSTGRLSSSNPNLQNIPIRTPEGNRIRKAFVASPGNKIAAADYSQIELRIMAHLSGDENLLDAFAKGQDVHARTASEVFGVPIEEVTPEQRRTAKAINFGLMYGMSAFGLAKQLGISREEAQAYMDTYFAKYPKVFEFIETLRQKAREQGYLDTIFGRRIYFPDINSRNKRVQAAAERAAINAPLQGSAADIIKRAMINVDKALRARHPDVKTIMQVHDELVFEVPSDKVKEVSEIITREMENAAQLKVPLKVDLGVGDNWQEAH
jgi:DNA polymerase-1